MNRYSDFIDTVTTRTTEFPMGLTEYRNLDKARIAGIEVKAHHNFVNGFQCARHVGLREGYEPG
ncbi:hypothetical protein DEA98_22790 [Brucella pseudogrignonensis]|nr:hypothetical protein [Brucella pseudogrignonensis]